MADRKIELRYGMNPHQTPAWCEAVTARLPFEVLNGRPGFINLLDALNGWQLVHELREAAGIPAAASFKHVNPAGVGLGLPLTDVLQSAYMVGKAELSTVALAYTRARGADRMASYGDFVAVSEPVDQSLADLLAKEVSDGIIAPAYEPAALETLRRKAKGRYLVLGVDPAFVPPVKEIREIFGVKLEEPRDNATFTAAAIRSLSPAGSKLADDTVRDILVALVTLKYTQSNSICLAHDGQTIGVGAGQQSRIHCTQLAIAKARAWHLRQHPQILSLQFPSKTRRVDRDNAISILIAEEAAKTERQWVATVLASQPPTLSAVLRLEWSRQLTNVTMASDGLIPFRDNVDRAALAGVTCIVQPGGSLRDTEVYAAAKEHGIIMLPTGVRLFHH